LDGYSQTFRIEQLPNPSKARNIIVNAGNVNLTDRVLLVFGNEGAYGYRFKTQIDNCTIYGPINEDFKINLINLQGAILKQYPITAGTDDIILNL